MANKVKIGYGISVKNKDGKWDRRPQIRWSRRLRGSWPVVEYKAWYHARARCMDPDHPSWKYYGGRGILFCAQWVDDFVAFYRHIGRRPAGRFSLDRIENDRGYEPGNVRWATQSVQMRNRRPRPKAALKEKVSRPAGRPRTRLHEFRGQRLHITEIASILGVCVGTLVYRLGRGIPIDKAKWARIPKGEAGFIGK